MRRMDRGVARGIVVLVLLAGIARAATYGTTHDYEILGFTADSKHVYFQKSSSGQAFSEKWMAVFDATTGKLKTSKPIYRENMMEESGNISDQVGEKTVAQLHAKLTPPVASTKLAPKSPPDKALALRELKAGHAQVFTGTDVEVRTLVKLRGKLKSHEAINDGETHSASFDVEISLVVKGEVTHTVKKRLYAGIVDNSFNGNIQEWPEFYVKEVAVAASNRALAFVFARKPHVILTPPKAAAKP